MTVQGRSDLLPNLVTAKFERSDVDIKFVRFLLARSQLRHLSVRESFGYRDVCLHRYLPRPPPQLNAQVLKVLDISLTGVYASTLVNDWVFNDEQCKVTHLFMERCLVVPRHVMPAHLKIEFLSIAGSRAYDGDMGIDGGNLEIYCFLAAWAKIPSMSEMNASGCILSQEQRDSLVNTRPNIAFDLSEDFRESPRFHF